MAINHVYMNPNHDEWNTGVSPFAWYETITINIQSLPFQDAPLIRKTKQAAPEK